MAAKLRWIVFVVSLAVCAALGYAAYSLAQVSWNAVVSYRSPYAASQLPQSGHGSAEVTRTVLVIIDGLRVDASRNMGTLNALREHGADLDLVAPQPSLSYPNWTTLLSGAPPYVSGVVTNWHEGPAPVETLFDTARQAGIRTVFVGPEDFEQLYAVKEKCTATFMRKWDEEYLTSTYVDEGLRLAKSIRPTFLVMHLPDIDEAGHAYGGASKQYAETVARVNADLNRLIQGLQDGNTVFVVVADHGHIDSGGHGGWESSVVTVPGIFAGPGMRISKGPGRSIDVAPTVASLIGAGVPRYASGIPLERIRRSVDATFQAAALTQRMAFEDAYVSTVVRPLGEDAAAAMAGTQAVASQGMWSMNAAEAVRMRYDRQSRLPIALVSALVCLAVLALIGAASWRALCAALAGTAAYYLVYNLLFFGVHRYAWSLSAFNSEDRIGAWMNGRLIEAAVAALVAAGVAAAVYPLLRERPKGPRGEYLAGWLTLGPATALATLATLGLQVAWFVWAWGIDPTWRLPDLKWGFKYDLDLVQATAVGLVALLAPLVTYVVGKYHPRVRRAATEE